jgi:hypothetical protein
MHFLFKKTIKRGKKNQQAHVQEQGDGESKTMQRSNIYVKRSELSRESCKQKKILFILAYFISFRQLIAKHKVVRKKATI